MRDYIVLNKNLNQLYRNMLKEKHDECVSVLFPYFLITITYTERKFVLDLQPKKKSIYN